MAQDIEAVEIFATGKHFGSRVTNITLDDLQEMVNSFNELTTSIEGFRPVLKLGHEEAQAFFGQNKGLPNLGFIDKIWVEGQKILANFTNVPDALVDLIKMRRFNSVSIEMFPKTVFNGREFKNVLVAVALLGAELPAVKGLKELAATLFTEMPDDPDFEGDKIELKETEDMTVVTYTQEQHDALVAQAVAAATATVKTEFEGVVATLTTKVETAETAKGTAETALREFEDATRKANAATMVDKAIEDGKLLPKQKDSALAFALSLSGTIKFGDTEKSAAEVFESFLSEMPKKIDLSEKGKGGSDDETGEFNTAAEEVHAKATALVKKSEGKLDYRDARTEVLTDEDLKLRYFEMEE